MSASKIPERGLHEVRVSPGGLRDTVTRLLADGGRVEGLFVAGTAEGDPEVRCAASLPEDGDLLLRAPVPSREIPTLVDLLPALDWDEREARDLHGVRFVGHEPHRALVTHPDDLALWTTPIVGEDVHQVAVGPIHAGVIESGHFRFHSVGERILHVDVRLFYKHRGLERAAEGQAVADAIRVVQRACAACAAANTIAFAQAVEQAMGLWPGAQTRRARTMLLELERLYNHVNDIGAICAGVGLAPGAMAFASFKERAQRIIQALVGHRFLFGSVGVGGSHLSISAPAAAAGRSDLRDLGVDVTSSWRDLLFNASLRDRTRGAGRRPREEARRLAEQDVVLRAVLAQPHVGEVRRPAVHLGRAFRRPELAEERRLPVPLLHEGRLVVGLATLAERVAEMFELAHQGGLGRQRGGRRRREGGVHLGEQTQLVLDDRMRHDRSTLTVGARSHKRTTSSRAGGARGDNASSPERAPGWREWAAVTHASAFA